MYEHCTNKNELCNRKYDQQQETNSGVMSLARWFRELRGGGKSSNGKETTTTAAENSAKNSKTKDERRIKLNRTNSALPANFTKYVVDEDTVDGPINNKNKRERKIKDTDKRRYSFNGGSISAKLARNPRNYLADARRNYNNNFQADEFRSYSSSYKTRVESTSPYKESQSMIGGELRKTRTSFEHKHANSTTTHVSTSAKGSCNNYINFDDSGTAVKNFDSQNCNSNAPPLPPLRGTSSLLAGRYISSTIGHEKYPSWPSSDLTACYTTAAAAAAATNAAITNWPTAAAATTATTTITMTTTTTIDEQLTHNGNYAKETTRLAVVKPQISQLKTVIENREPKTTKSPPTCALQTAATTNGIDVIFETKAIDDEARSREKVYMRHLECERIFADDEDNAPCPPDRDISLAKSGHLSTTAATAAAAAYHHQYSHSHQDSSYMSQDGDYAECYVDEGRTLLTKAELEQYTKDYEEGIVKNSHQKQPSYAQSEGYHSYVSSNDSAIITPLLDRLRRENDVIVSAEENIVADRESSASSGSSSDTLKWHGSLSDVSVASSSYHRGSINPQHIAHSARVQTPQRHHSESVLYLDAITNGGGSGGASINTSTVGGCQQPQPWCEKTTLVKSCTQMSSQMRKLFPVNTYSVQPAAASIATNTITNLNDNSPTSPKMTVAERINALERQQQQQQLQQQQQQQQQQNCIQQSTKYIYFDPEKKHKVSGQDLKVMQKKALLLYYERHHSSWRSEPQLSPIPSPPQPMLPPPSSHRPRLPTPTSRRSSSASDYQDSINKEGVVNCNNDCDVTSVPSGYTHQNESKVHSQYSSSCGSLFASEVGPMIVGEPISVDDWVPALPPKKAHLRASFAPRHIPSPDLPPPSPPPVVDDEVFISDEPLPPPPPEIIASPSAPKTNAAAVPPDLILSSSLDDRNRAANTRGLDEQRLTTAPAVRRTQSRNKSGDFSRYSQHLYQDEVLTAEYKNQLVEADKAWLETTFARPTSSPSVAVPATTTTSTSRSKNSQFLAKRSVFADGFLERQSLQYSSTHKLRPTGGGVGGKSSTRASDGGQSNSALERSKIITTTNYEQNRNGCLAYGFESKSTKVENKIGKNAQFSAVLRHSEKFPAKLDPHCPPTSYQLSQSSYRREPRDREKRLPNFESGYKRTMSPSPSRTNITNGFVNGTCVKDVENIDQKSRISSEISTTTTTTTLSSNGTAIVSAKYEIGRHLATAVPVSTAIAIATPIVPVAVRCASHAAYREHYQNPTTNLNVFPTPPPAAALFEQPTTTMTTVESSPSIVVNEEYSSKTLPNNAANATITDGGENNLVEPTKQRSCRTPRTQSDPSSVKDAASSTANLLASHSSASSTNLQKSGGGDSPPLSTVVVCGIPRSQSDLSNVGSTESGYSSLSLNLPSPSVSPTRLSSTSSSSSCCSSASGQNANATATPTVTSWSCSAGVQCDMVNAAMTGSSTSHHDTRLKRANDDEQCCKYSQKSEIVLRVNATTNDAASQTEGLTDGVEDRKKNNDVISRPADAILVKAVPAACSWKEDSGSTSPIFVERKSQDEIDCERLSHELISHLSYDDRLFKILDPKSCIKRSTNYLTNLFKTTTVPFSEYSSCSTQSDDNLRLRNRNTISSNERSYQNETATCRFQDSKICDNVQRIHPLTMHQMRQKIEKLIHRLDHRINVLKAEQTAITEEYRVNDTLGETISEKVSKAVSTQEAAKYKLHIQEIGHITSLLLGLSGRLAKVENSLQEFTSDNQAEKKSLESKRDKLICQLEEAKMLKTNIDKRGFAVAALLVKHFTDEEIAEYEYFVHMKSKLLIDGREIAEKIEYKERQLTALKDSTVDEKFQQ